MKALLLSCRSPFLDDSKIYAPMANLYLKSYVEKAVPGCEVILGDDDYSLEDSSWAEPYDIIGISIMTPQREESLKLLQAIKGKYPDKKVVAGGPHCKHYLDDIIKEPYDYIVPWDGERALSKILAGGAPERVIRDVMSKKDIQEAPRPDRSSQNAMNTIKRYHYNLQGRPATTMMTARGCPERCRFCEDAMTTVKWSSLENLRGEMDDIKTMGYEAVYIFDDLFALAMPSIKPICEELKKHDFIYRCNGQVRYFTMWQDKFAELLASTGCVEIAFGHESGSQKILDNIEKRTKVEMNYRSVEYAHKHGIKVKSFLMLGLPGEDEETVRETEKFIATSGIDDFQLCVLMPYRGTKIREMIDRKEEIDLMMTVPEASGAYGIKGGETVYEVRTAALSGEDLKRIRNELVEKYKPKSHQEAWKDKFRDLHLSQKVEYGITG